MEFGPRALGHRSILAPADRPETTTRLGAALRREDFMPFAPLLREEDTGACFEGFEAAAGAARFMTVALPATARFRAACPAAIHVDGTARPQVVHRAERPGLHALLTRYVERTGLPAVVNTSFNLHEEPIVHTPRDAVRAFRESGLARMRLGPWVLDAASASSPREVGRARRAVEPAC
jgi:carbamoyltransferase